MADYTVTFGKRGKLTAQFEPEKTLTLKNQPVDKTNLQDLNDVRKVDGDSLQNGDILQYDATSNNFVYKSGALVRDANNEFIVIGDAILPALGRDVSLGSKTRPFKTVFVQSNTITIGNVSLSDSGFGSLTLVREVPVNGGTETVNFGTLSTISTANQMTIGTDIANAEFHLDDGAVQKFTSNTNVVQAIDALNEAILNVHQNTFVRNVQFTADPTSGGAGTNVRLTITAEGTPNQYDVNWGDGTIDTQLSDDTPAHVYTDNDNSPYSITVTARNTDGYGAGSNNTSTIVDLINIFARDPEPVFEVYNSLTDGNTITEANTGQTIYLDNDSRHISNSSVTASYSVDWGDSTSSQIASKIDAGGDQGDRLPHTYTQNSGSGLFTLTLNIETMSTATPGLLPLSNTQSLKVFDIAIGAPNDITGKTLSWNTSTVGSSPALASGFVANTNVSGKSAGDSISAVFPRFTTGTVTTGTMSTYFHTTGSVTAQFNDTDSVVSATTTESGVDYYNYDADGNDVTAVQRIHAPNLYETGTKATISLNVSDFDFGVNKLEFVTDEGNSEELFYVYDNLSTAPTIDVSSATISETSASYNYISGVPYYDSGDSLSVSDISIQNLTGQTYYNATPFTITATNVEGSSGSGVDTQNYSYTDALNSSDRSSGIPLANLSSVNVETLGVNIGSGDRVVTLNFNATNVNGTDQEQISSTKIQVFNGTDVINESSIPVSSSLGQGFTNNGVRISGLTGTTGAYSSSTDYFADNAWSGAVTVAGTNEAIVRYGALRHFATDLSSGHLPVGPDLATSRSGAQVARFAFKRSSVSNFRVRLTGKISGFFYAAPGTAIDGASTINGWVDAGVQYNGSGFPGADTGAGGNGSNGGAFTGADRIIDGTTYNNDTFDLTFGTVSTTDSYNNQVLIAIVLNSDDSLTALSIEDTD